LEQVAAMWAWVSEHDIREMHGQWHTPLCATPRAMTHVNLVVGSIHNSIVTRVSGPLRGRQGPSSPFPPFPWQLGLCLSVLALFNLSPSLPAGAFLVLRGLS
jgi:hypothetical protein